MYREERANAMSRKAFRPPKPRKCTLNYMPPTSLAVMLRRLPTRDAMAGAYVSAGMPQAPPVRRRPDSAPASSARLKSHVDSMKPRIDFCPERWPASLRPVSGAGQVGDVGVPPKRTIHQLAAAYASEQSSLTSQALRAQRRPQRQRSAVPSRTYIPTSPQQNSLRQELARTSWDLALACARAHAPRAATTRQQVSWR